jgi:hypothetical protein
LRKNRPEKSAITSGGTHHENPAIHAGTSDGGKCAGTVRDEGAKTRGLKTAR